MLLFPSLPAYSLHACVSFLFCSFSSKKAIIQKVVVHMRSSTTAFVVRISFKTRNNLSECKLIYVSLSFRSSVFHLHFICTVQMSYFPTFSVIRFLSMHCQLFLLVISFCLSRSSSVVQCIFFSFIAKKLANEFFLLFFET